MAPGKAVAWSIAFLAAGAGISFELLVLANWAAPIPPDDFLQAAAVQAACLLLGFGLATWILGIKVLGFWPAALGWARPAIGLRGFVLGLGLGLGPALIALILGVVAGSAEWSLDGGGVGAWTRVVGLTAATLLPAALAEEVVFRGVPLVLLAAAFGRWPAAVGLSVLFGAAHLLNPGIGALALGNIALAGLFLSACFFLPGGLWAATGAHLGWNLGLAALAAPVSGLPLPMPMLDYASGGPAWLTGGEFGPEGGVAATIALLAVTALLVPRLRKESVA